jgi:enterochelin esterase family protein
MDPEGWTPNLKGRIEPLVIDSKVLAGNPLGDPARRETPIYLPPGYDDDAPLPVVVCLTGFTGTGRQLLHDTPWRRSVPVRYESLLARGVVGPMVLAFPDAFTRLGGSQYMNSTAVGRYEDHVIDEIFPAIAERFRVGARPRSWGVMGKSSGGFGALRLAMLHPESLAALACHSGDMYFTYCYLPDFPKAARLLERHGGLHGFMKTFDDQPRKLPEYVTALNIVAMAACYSPSRSGRGIDLPFDIKTGKIIDEVWARWLENDPLTLLEREDCRAALLGMRLVYLDCGKRDEFNLQYGARIFAERLGRLGITHRHEEFDDGHFDIGYRQESSLAKMWAALK